MPKLKTHRGAAKRFKLTGGKKVKFRHANRNHILTKRSTAQKRRLRVGSSRLNESDAKLVRRMLQGS